MLGTRPEIIKLAPVARHLDRTQVIWTGQHYDPELVDVITRGDFPEPVWSLDGVGGSSRSVQITTAMTSLVAAFERTPPGAVVVQGDTNSANAAAQAAHYCDVPIVHVEAGLRSWDRAMPEERNRQIVGVVADLHCCPTAGNADNLRRAGVPDALIEVTGNPIVEATREHLPDLSARLEVLERFGVADGAFVLATIHRPENTDDGAALAAVLGALGRLPWPVVLPLHPRTARSLETFKLNDLAATLHLVNPLDHAAFLALVNHARLVVSDSGGVQEEVTALGRPLVVVRNSTERPEAVEAGFSMLARPAEISAAVAAMTSAGVAERLSCTPCPFGDGHAGERIAAAIARLLPRSTNLAAVG